VDLIHRNGGAACRTVHLGALAAAEDDI